MKTTILTAALMIMMTSATVRASDDTSSVYRPDSPDRGTAIKLQSTRIIEFRVTSPDHEKLTFKIYSEKNNKIYQRTLRNDNGVRFGCDMSDFTPGTYVAVIEKNGQEITRKEVTIR